MRVVIIQSFIKRFRVPFYERLERTLHGDGIELQVVFGQPDRFNGGDTDIVSELPFGYRTVNSYFYAGNHSLVWQPALSHLNGADLVIVQQGNRHLLNHLLLARRRTGGFRLAFWGHGRNFQGDGLAWLLERIKAWYSRLADHWFAYTDRSRAVLRGLGIPDERITTVNNAIDTCRLTECYENVSQSELDALRRRLGLCNGEAVAVYCGRFSRYKSLDFMCACAQRIRANCRHFRLILMGEGQQADRVQRFASRNPGWVRYLGPQYGREKAAIFRLAACQIMPGAVGLGVLDSLAMQTPLITQELDSHGPEIEYLQDGVNGLITASGKQAYTAGVLRFLEDRALRDRLVDGCRRTRQLHTIERMAECFRQGVLTALARN